MTIPSQEAQRSRQTAMEAERHWWVERLRSVVERGEDPSSLMDTEDLIRALDSLIAERTK